MTDDTRTITADVAVGTGSELLCRSCVWREHPEMLTTYCLRGLQCERCERDGELAITRPRALPKCDLCGGKILPREDRHACPESGERYHQRCWDIEMERLERVYHDNTGTGGAQSWPSWPPR